MSLEAFVRRLVHATGKLDMSVEYITMFDDINPGTMPSGSNYAYACYIDGLWPYFHELAARFPKAAEKGRLLDVAVFASDNATCLDIERGDATIEQAPEWFERQVLRGVYRPVLYTSASNMKALELAMARRHIPRSAYRLWSAHYTGKAHICGPKTCGYGMSLADGTQWTDFALGVNLDESLLLGSFFDPRPAPPAPKPVDPPAPVPTPDPDPAPGIPSWQETIMNTLPALKQGDKDETGKPPWVRVMQSCLQAQGHAHKVEAAVDNKADGDFGLKTTNALLAIQEAFGLHDSKEYAERVCGPETWAVLVTGAK